MALDRITDLAAFIRVADARSFTIAAEQLGMSRSAVGKCVVRLEDHLGVRLLHRTTRSVTPTDEGEAFYVRCARILADLEEIELDMASRTEQPRGRLRLDLPVSFGRLHVLPILHRFMETWPEVVVNVTFTDRYVDLIEEGIDIAIRIGGEEDSQLVGRTLARHRLVTCVSSEYAASHGVPMTPADLATHSCLAFTHGGRPTEWRFQSQDRADESETVVNVLSVPVHGRFCTSNAESLRDAVLAGYGIGQLAAFLVGDDLRAGRLQPILETHALDGPPIRVVYPTGRYLSPKVRHFIDLLAESWRPEPPWDNGT